MKRIILLLSVFFVLLTGCTKKIDGTSDDTMKTSIEEIKKSLDAEKRGKFEESMKLIMLQGFDLKNIFKEGNVDKTVDDIKTKLNGKSADEIIVEGNRIKTEIERKKKIQAKSEIEELYQKKANAEKDKISLSKFQIIRSRFYKRKEGTYYVTEKPIIELTVLNGTEKAISRAYFNGTLSSPNRSVPWLQDEFNYQISGGLEPGEKVTWYLAPNMFSDWGTVKAPKNAVLLVDVTKLDDANGNELYSTNNFGESEKERLKELLTAYPEFKSNLDN